MTATRKVLLAVLLLPAALSAQGPEPGTVILPPHHDPALPFPVIVLFPASNGTAQSFLNTYVAPDNAIVVLAAGRGSPDDYRTGDNWTRTIARYESQLLADVATLQSHYQIDTTRVVLAGFSMGGDLAWALALRNPTRVTGAIIMSSRASYRGRPADMRLLQERGARFFMTMGAAEDSTRRAGALAAVRLLESTRITHSYHEIPNAGHSRAPPDVWQRALDYILAPR